MKFQSIFVLTIAFLLTALAQGEIINEFFKRLSGSPQAPQGGLVKNFLNRLNSAPKAPPKPADIANQLGDQSGNQLANQLGDQSGNRLVDQLGDQLSDQLGDQLSNQLGDQLGNRLVDQLGDQSGNQLNNEVDAAIRNFMKRIRETGEAGRELARTISDVLSNALRNS